MDTKKTEVVQPEGNYYDKYHSTNPIVKWMMKGFKDAISEVGAVEKAPKLEGRSMAMFVSAKPAK